MKDAANWSEHTATSRANASRQTSSPASPVAISQARGAAPFEDHRPELAAQRQRQQHADGSLQVRQLRALQTLANAHQNGQQSASQEPEATAMALLPAPSLTDALPPIQQKAEVVQRAKKKGGGKKGGGKKKGEDDKARRKKNEAFRQKQKGEAMKEKEKKEKPKREKKAVKGQKKEAAKRARQQRLARLVSKNNTKIKNAKEKVIAARTVNGQTNFNAGKNTNTLTGAEVTIPGGTNNPIKLDKGDPKDGFQLVELVPGLDSSDSGIGKLRFEAAGENILIHVT